MPRQTRSEPATYHPEPTCGQAAGPFAAGPSHAHFGHRGYEPRWASRVLDESHDWVDCGEEITDGRDMLVQGANRVSRSPQFCGPSRHFRSAGTRTEALAGVRARNPVVVVRARLSTARADDEGVTVHNRAQRELAGLTAGRHARSVSGRQHPHEDCGWCLPWPTAADCIRWSRQDSRVGRTTARRRTTMRRTVTTAGQCPRGVGRDQQQARQSRPASLRAASVEPPTSPRARSSPPLVRDDDDVSVLLDCSSRHRSKA